MDLTIRLRWESRMARICAQCARKHRTDNSLFAYYLALTEMHRKRASYLRHMLHNL